jgi:hypothetical protein
MIKRIILELAFLMIIILLPVWVSILLGLALLYYFRSFNEIVVFGFIMDIYYSQISVSFNLFDYKFTILALIMLFISFYLKKFLKFYNK